MGRRVILIAGDVLLGLLKGYGDRYHWVEVENPLPADAKIVGWEMPGDERYAQVVIQSDSWFGDSRDPLRAPHCVTHVFDPLSPEDDPPLVGKDAEDLSL